VIRLISDEQLATQFQQGKESAFEAIVHRYHGPIHAYIVRMGGEYHVANDIVQEVFIKICRNINQYRSSLPLRPWIFAIASNAYKDYLKKTYVSRDITGLDNLEEFTVSTNIAENKLLAKDQREQILTAVHSLREIYREVLVLRYYQDLKLDDIALTLKIPVGTVKSRLSTALHQLKEMFAEGADCDEISVKR